MNDPFRAAGLAGEPITQCLVVDAHGHWGPNPVFPCPDSSVPSQLASMDRMGVDLFCASATPAFLGLARRGNDMVIDAVEQHPDRFFGYMAVDIGYPERIRPELQRCLDAGCRGIKIWSSSFRPGYSYGHTNYQGVFEFAEANDLPILAHSSGGSPAQDLHHLEQKLGAFPGVNVLLAHAGSSEPEAYARLAEAYPNAFLELCYSRCPRGLVEFFVHRGLSDKVIWGSDAIFMSAEIQLGRILFAQIPPADKEKILGANAARALGASV